MVSSCGLLHQFLQQRNSSRRTPVSHGAPAGGARGAQKTCRKRKTTKRAAKRAAKRAGHVGIDVVTGTAATAGISRHVLRVRKTRTAGRAAGGLIVAPVTRPPSDLPITAAAGGAGSRPRGDVGMAGSRQSSRRQSELEAGMRSTVVMACFCSATVLTF
jgi:hypothetical protein